MKPFPTSAACCFGILFISVSLITTGSSEVVGSADTVVALTGDDVILPCFLKTSVSAKNMVVEWTRLNLTPENVHLYRDNRDSYEEQHPFYRGRTSLFNDELKNGNVSLKLTRVTLSDAGSYRCFIPTLTSQVKETTVQLFVGAVSQPVISIDGTKGWGVVLKCESGGWFPEPEMEWLDSSGTILPADGPPERHSYSEGLYTVRRHVTVDQTDTNRFTCRVQQPEINHKKETEFHVPYEVFPKSQVGLIVGLIITAVGVLAASAVGVYMWRKHKEKKLKKLLEEQGQARFVDIHRFYLIQTVTMVIPKAFYLIRSEKYSKIHAARTRQDQMELLYKALDSGGEKLKSDFYRILQDLEPDLIINMGQARFVDIHRFYLIQTVTTVIPIAFYLIRSEKYSQIHAARTRLDQMRLLYEALDSAWVTLKLDFYRILQDLEPDLITMGVSDEEDPSSPPPRMQMEVVTRERDQVIKERGDAQFVDINRFYLIHNVTMVIPIAFYLIRSEKYSEIHAAWNKQEKMELLYEALDSGGEKLKSDFYRILLDLEPDAVSDLDQAITERTLFGCIDQVIKERDQVIKERDEVTRERDELKEELRKALSTSPGGQQKTQTPSQKGMEMKPLLGPEMEMQPLLGPGMEMQPLLGPGMEMKPLLGPEMEMKPLLGQKDDLDEMERGGRVTTEVDYNCSIDFN